MGEGGLERVRGGRAGGGGMGRRGGRARPAAAAAAAGALLGGAAGGRRLGTVEDAVLLHGHYFSSRLEGGEEEVKSWSDIIGAGAGARAGAAEPLDMRPSLQKSEPVTPPLSSKEGSVSSPSEESYGGVRGGDDAEPTGPIEVEEAGVHTGDVYGEYLVPSAQRWAIVGDSGATGGRGGGEPPSSSAQAPPHEYVRAPEFVPCTSDDLCQELPGRGSHCFCKTALPLPAPNNPGYCACLVKVPGTSFRQHGGGRGRAVGTSRTLRDPAPPDTPVLLHVPLDPSGNPPQYPLRGGSGNAPLPPAPGAGRAPGSLSLWGTPGRAEEAMQNIVQASNGVQMFAKALSTGIVGLSGGTSALRQTTLQHQGRMNNVGRAANPEETMTSRAEESLGFLDGLGIPGLASAANYFLTNVGLVPAGFYPEEESPSDEEPADEAPQALPPNAEDLEPQPPTAEAPMMQAPAVKAPEAQQPAIGEPETQILAEPEPLPPVETLEEDGSVEAANDFWWSSSESGG